MIQTHKEICDTPYMFLIFQGKFATFLYSVTFQKNLLIYSKNEENTVTAHCQAEVEQELRCISGWSVMFMRYQRNVETGVGPI